MTQWSRCEGCLTQQGGAAWWKNPRHFCTTATPQWALCHPDQQKCLEGGPISTTNMKLLASLFSDALPQGRCCFCRGLIPFPGGPSATHIPYQIRLLRDSCVVPHSVLWHATYGYTCASFRPTKLAVGSSPTVPAQGWWLCSSHYQNQLEVSPRPLDACRSGFTISFLHSKQQPGGKRSKVILSPSWAGWCFTNWGFTNVSDSTQDVRCCGIFPGLLSIIRQVPHLCSVPWTSSLQLNGLLCYFEMAEIPGARFSSSEASGLFAFDFQRKWKNTHV